MPKVKIHLISGGTCRTAKHVLRACLAQFTDPDAQVICHHEVRTVESVKRIVEEVNGQHAVICHTLVEPTVHRCLTEMALHRGIPAVDLLGPTLSVLGDLLSEEALGRPGLLYELHREQFDRIDAVDFTMAHDDGNRLQSIREADVIVTGVSRVSKSVTCFYLASRGIRAANVPLIDGQDPPQELVEFRPDRVFGLTMNASHLASIRQARLRRISDREVPHYATVRALNREIHFAEKLMETHGWHRVDVSYMATEEVASLILDELRKRLKPRRRSTGDEGARTESTGG